MDNKRVTNKQILDKINDLKVGDEGLNALAIKIVSRMVKLKSMEDWFDHVNRSDIAGSVGAASTHTSSIKTPYPYPEVALKAM